MSVVRTSVRCMSSGRAANRIAAMEAEFDELPAEPLESLSTAERTELAHQWERLMRRLPAMGHRLVAALGRSPPRSWGEPSLAAALSTLLRISKAEPHHPRRRGSGARSALTGEGLQPVLAHTAAAQARGEIGAEHVKIIGPFFDRLPVFVDHHTREVAETDLAQIACGLKPEELRQAADRLAILLDQDGRCCWPEPSGAPASCAMALSVDSEVWGFRGPKGVVMKLFGVELNNQPGELAQLGDVCVQRGVNHRQAAEFGRKLADADERG
jgi:Domain of unknown function (DUF222)